MRIILDTNVIQEDFLMRSGRFEILFDYSAKTQSTFVLPRIVHDELAENYRRELQNRLNKAIRAKEQLNGILLQPDLRRIELDPAAEARDYLTYVLRRLRVREGEIHEYGTDYLRDVLERAIQRRRPCTDRGEEIRDAVLWQSVLEIAQATQERVAFISKNTDQFTADRIALHPDLAAEAATHGIEIEYFASLEEFAKRHATRIAFITKEWLEARIDPDLVYDAVFDKAVETAAEIAHRRAGIAEEVLGSYSNAGGGVELDEFFVYEMSSGEHRVEAVWYGHAEVEYDVEVDGLDTFSYGRGDRRTRTAEVVLRATVEAIIKDGALTDWRVVDAYAESD
jgi:hypothetical protein